jgi:hypothetical protein
MALVHAAAKGSFFQFSASESDYAWIDQNDVLLQKLV